MIVLTGLSLGVALSTIAVLAVALIAAELNRRANARVLAAVRASEESIRSHEAFLRQVINANPNPVFVRDWNGIYILANKALADVYDATVSDVVGKKVADFMKDKDFVQRFMDEDREVMSGIEARNFYESVPHVATGQRRWYQTVKIPLSGPNDADRRMLGVATDITERKLLEDQLRQAQKMEAIGQLTGGIAHDLNNLLTVILANVSLIAPSVTHLQPELLHDFEDLKNAASRGASMVRKLLAFSRRETLAPQSLHVEQLCSDLLNTMRRLLPATIDVSLRASESIPVIRADAVAVQQMLLNLATNARDAMPGGGSLLMEISRVTMDEHWNPTHGWGKPGDYVCVAVSDNGTGMDAATRERIFEPFFTTKPQGEGTGLGLPMVYGLMRQHDGFIDVYSELGIGTAIRLYFPAAAEPEEERVAVRIGTPSGGSETILVADDEEPIRRSITRVLERHGYKVLTAANGAEAMEIMNERGASIQLVISDVIMPVMGGRELYAGLQSIKNRVPFLFTSGYTAREATDTVDLDPNVPFLHKPWAMADLLQKVREVVDSAS